MLCYVNMSSREAGNEVWSEDGKSCSSHWSVSTVCLYLQMILTLEGLLMILSPSHKENSEVLKASIVLFTSILFIYTVTEKL